MKNFFKVIASVAFVCTITTLSGCGFTYSSNNSQIQLTSLTGLKMTYNDGTYALDDTFELYSKHILNEIYADFAMPSTTERKIDTYPLDSAKNYDKIRVQVNSANEVELIGWKWSFSRTLAGCESQTTYDNIISYYSNTNVQENYLNQWTSLYTIPLEIVAIQIAMGQTPQVFTIYTNNQTTTVYTDSTKTKQVDANYLAEIKEQFKTDGTYVGFTQENITTFKNYLLNEVVGGSIIGTQYDKIEMSNGTITYSTLFDKILALDAGLNKDFYTPYPASYVQDVTDNSIFAGQSPNILSHVTAREYQSATIITSKDTFIYSIYLAFEATYDLALDVHVRFYNNTTQDVTYYDYTYNISAGTFNGNNWKLVDFGQKTDLSLFNNTEVASATQTQISNTNQNSKYYTYSSKGSYIEGDLLECDCITISFCPQKTQNGYYPFKWAIDVEMGA